MSTHRSITFAATVPKRQRSQLGSFIDTELRVVAKACFGDQDVAFCVTAYPGGMNINNVHYPSGTVVKILARALDGVGQVTYVAGCEGKRWSAMSLNLLPPQPKRKKR